VIVSERLLDRRRTPAVDEREPAGMPAREFNRRFGGSCRTKHVLPLPMRRRAWLQLGWRIARNRVALLERRPYPLPAQSELPLEFIRLDPWEADYLYVLAAQAEVGIVEIGRMRGGSTFLLAAANARVPIWSIDVAPEDDERLRSLLDEHQLGANVSLLVGNSQTDPFAEIGPFDLLFVDGDHSYAGCSRDLHAFVPRLAEQGHVLLHDSYQDCPVQQAVVDYLAEDDLDIVRSPFIPAAHWHSSYGSVAHLRRPREEPSTSDRSLTPRPSATRRHPEVAPRRRRPVRLVAATAAILAAIFMLLPEALGDWPYDPISHSSNGHPAHHAPPVRSAS
jgi:predicted O-methyltransferase YrrM